MIQICEIEKCTGCEACVNKCPKQCITMKADTKLGHTYPIINQEVCIDCGLCEKNCPCNHPIEQRDIITAFAGWSKNLQEYKSCTSGGAATAISRYIIREGGIVYGCAMLPGVNIKHVRIEKEEDLYKLKGSKYVQSYIDGAYKMALNDLKDGKKVLFIGTPCQTAAIIKLAGSRNKDLYTIDLICHGVPSQTYLKQHVIDKVGTLDDVIVQFRGEEGYQLTIIPLNQHTSNLKQYSSNMWNRRYQDAYINSFFDGFISRNSCQNCQYASSKRVSDITIGDFWGLGNKEPFIYEHKYGCSVLLPTTNKGMDLIKGIATEFNLYERSVEEAVNGNDQLRHPFHASSRIKLFNIIYPFIGIGKAYKLSIIDKLLIQRYYRIRCNMALFYRKLKRK